MSGRSEAATRWSAAAMALPEAPVEGGLTQPGVDVAHGPLVDLMATDVDGKRKLARACGADQLLVGGAAGNRIPHGDRPELQECQNSRRETT
jgi:hypothetical protein